MNTKAWQEIKAARQAAIEVLQHNAKGPFQGLPRTAGWGYPEAYTRDLMLALLGVGVTGDKELLAAYKKVLKRLAANQSERGHITGLAHTKNDRGASDTTPLFLLGVGIFRKISGEPDFLQDAVKKAMTWMDYQSPSDDYIVAQLPTSDWRDEQWVLGYGLFVNAITYSYLRLYGEHKKAAAISKVINKFVIKGTVQHHQEGLAVKRKPYYALWSYKVYSSERFDLLGNSLAILSGLASASRAKHIIAWIEKECSDLKKQGLLALDIPPNFFPFIEPGDPDWIPRYEKFNLPGDYHNGGIWPFITGLYVAALVAAKKFRLAEEKLLALTRAIKSAREKPVEYGFNEWLKAQTGQPMGQDWQTWSAALYIYAVKCVEERRTPFFEEVRK